MDSFFLKKHDDGALYGPASIDQLRDWALAAKVSPLDRVSTDNQKSWKRAPMIPELHMDWLVEVNKDFLYGPTTFGTVQEFIAAGEIDGDTTVINCREGKTAKVKDMPVFNNGPRRNANEELLRRATTEANITGTESEKLLKLERLILELRLAVNDAETRYQRLRVKYIEDTGKEPN
jgi:hypothetical protein